MSELIDELEHILEEKAFALICKLSSAAVDVICLAADRSPCVSHLITRIDVIRMRFFLDDETSKWSIYTNPSKKSKQILDRLMKYTN